jgi:O-acetyl-ADP-ribose deacetylase (regulator of RNase III)
VIEVRQGELATVLPEVQAVVRPVAADWSAVTPAMRRLEMAAGPLLEEQCQRLGELPVGSAAITQAGALAVELMVHVVVRSREEPVSRAVVQRGLRNGLWRAAEWSFESVALAPIGTGAGNLDVDEVAAVMMPVLVEHLGKSTHPARVIIVVDSEYERDAFERELRRHAPEFAAGAE